MSRRIIRRSSSVKAPKIFILKLGKKTALAKYVRKMGFHTDPSKEDSRKHRHHSGVMTLLKKQNLSLAIGDASKRSKGSRLKGVS